MFLETFGFQGKALGTPRRALSRGQVSPVRIARYLFSVATPVTPVEPPAPAGPAEAVFSHPDLGVPVLTFTSKGVFDNYRIAIIRDFAVFQFYYAFYLYSPNGSLTLSRTGQDTSLSSLVTFLQATLSFPNSETVGFEITYDSQYGNNIIYSNSSASRDATPVD